MSGFRLVGVLHLPPLPGAANYDGAPVRAIAERAAEDALVLEQAGFTDVMVQDASDKPQRALIDAPTVAAMSAVGAAVASRTSLRLGVVAGHNDGASAVAIAHAIGASFVRVKVLTGASVGPQGLLQGCAVEVAEMRRRLSSSVEVWADAHEATSRALTGEQSWAALEAVKFGAADVLVVTDDRGVDVAVEAIRSLREVVPGTPIVIGGRVSAATAALAAGGSDGAIIGNAIKTGSGHDARIDLAKAEELARATFASATV